MGELLHNQTALRIKSALRFEPAVTVTSVPWVLGAPPQIAAHAAEAEPEAVGAATP